MLAMSRKFKFPSLLLWAIICHPVKPSGSSGRHLGQALFVSCGTLIVSYTQMSSIASSHLLISNRYSIHFIYQVVIAQNRSESGVLNFLYQALALKHAMRALMHTDGFSVSRPCILQNAQAGPIAQRASSTAMAGIGALTDKQSQILRKKAR